MGQLILAARAQTQCARLSLQMSHSLNSLEGGLKGDYSRLPITRLIKGDTCSLDYIAQMHVGSLPTYRSHVFLTRRTRGLRKVNPICGSYSTWEKPPDTYASQVESWLYTMHIFIL